MRAWLLPDTSGPSAYTLGEVPTPEPGPGEVRIALRASALNHLDLWVSMGLPAPHHFPHIAGADGAGVVDAFGDGVTGVTVGDEVVVDPSMSCGTCPACTSGEIVYCRSYRILGEHLPGTLGEYVVVPAANAIPKPATLSWEEAGSFGLVTGTAHRMLRRARLAPGSKVLVVGAGGGVSTAAVGLAVAAGAEVWVTSRDEAKVARAVEAGARGGFDSATPFSKEVKATTDGGVDVVVESVGAATWEQSMRSLVPGGRLVTCGATAGPKVEVSVPYLFFKQLELIGSTMFTRREFAEVVDLVGSGRVPVVVDSVHPFEDLPAALARLDAADQYGKVVLAR